MYTEIQFLSDPSLIIGYPCHSLTLNLLQLRLLMLLMLMPSNVLKTVWCRLGSGSLVIMLNFCSDIGHKVWSRF